jgi:hypothetical protein
MAQCMDTYGWPSSPHQSLLQRNRLPTNWPPQIQATSSTYFCVSDTSCLHCHDDAWGCANQGSGQPARVGVLSAFKRFTHVRPRGSTPGMIRMMKVDRSKLDRQVNCSNEGTNCLCGAGSGNQSTALDLRHSTQRVHMPPLGMWL